LFHVVEPPRRQERQEKQKIKMEKISNTCHMSFGLLLSFAIIGFAILEFALLGGLGVLAVN
jgi:hypothetical protein